MYCTPKSYSTRPFLHKAKPLPVSYGVYGVAVYLFSVPKNLGRQIQLNQCRRCTLQLVLDPLDGPHGCSCLTPMSVTLDTTFTQTGPFNPVFGSIVVSIPACHHSSRATGVQFPAKEFFFFFSSYYRRNQCLLLSCTKSEVTSTTVITKVKVGLV